MAVLWGVTLSSSGNRIGADGMAACTNPVAERGGLEMHGRLVVRL